MDNKLSTDIIGFQELVLGISLGDSLTITVCRNFEIPLTVEVGFEVRTCTYSEISIADRKKKRYEMLVVWT